MKKKQKIIIAILVLVLFLALGLGYAFLPHESRINLNITFGLSEFWNILIGISIAVLGLISFFLILLTDALKKFRKYGKKYWYLFIIWDIAKWIIIIAIGYFLIRGGIGIGQSVLI